MKLSYKARTWLLVLCAVACGAYLAREPFQVYKQQKAKATQSQMSAQQDLKKLSDLRQEEARFNSPLGREELARAQGFRRKDETPLGTNR